MRQVISGHVRTKSGRPPDLSFASARGPGCVWQGKSLMLLDRTIGGLRFNDGGPEPWLMRLDRIELAFKSAVDVDFALGDRGTLLQMAVDAMLWDEPDAAEAFADLVRFPTLTPAEAQRVQRSLVPWLAGDNPRVSYKLIGWDEEAHPRRPAGSPDGTGGEFAPKQMASDPVDEGVRMSRFARELQHADASHRQQQMFYEVFNAEGFGQRDPKDLDQPVQAVAGIRQSTLDAAKAAGVVLKSTALERMTYRDVVKIYQWNAESEIARIGGATRYEEFRDAKDATAIFDTLFAHGHGAGAKMIQEGINETLLRLSDADLKRLGLPVKIEADGVLGSRSFRILTILANNGHGTTLRRHIADRRRKWVGNRKDRQGWLARIARFE